MLARLGNLCDHAEGEILFRPREAPGALYLVVGGVAEIRRREAPDHEFEPVAYVGPGATLAASKVITGTPFEAFARFPDGGQTLQWPRTLILRKLAGSRAFSMLYLQNLARRLEDRFASQGGRGLSKLGGSLDHFDLPSILQTVVDSGATGVLEVRDAEDRRFGSIFIRERRIGPMQCGTLTGPEAFFEILLSPPDLGSFSFASVRRPPSHGELHELAPLLFEAARMQDEYNRFRSELPGDTLVRPSEHQQESSESGGSELMEQIYRALADHPTGWERLADRFPYSRCQVALAVRDLLRAGVLTARADPQASSRAS